jgi:hypothetical protein
MTRSTVVKPMRIRCIRTLAAALIAFIANTAAATEANVLHELHRLALRIDSGNVQEVLPATKALAKKYPHDDTVARFAVRTLLSAKDYAAAKPLLQAMLQRHPDDARACYAMAIASAATGDPAAAIAWLRKAAATGRIDVSSIRLQSGLGNLVDDPRFADVLSQPAALTASFAEPVTVIREWDGESSNDQFGWIARDLGDVDGDGSADFVTSAPTNAAGGPGSGKVYVYSSHSGKLLWSAIGEAGDQLGTGLESAGDIDADGVQDVVAGAPGHEKAIVYSGRDGHILLTLHGEAERDAFGNHVASVGDMDGDGRADFIVGAPGNSASGKGAGRAYVYSGGDGHLLLQLDGEKAGDAFGSACTGYTKGNSRLLVVGAPGGGPRATGRVYVYDGLSTKPRFTFDADATGRQLGYMFLAVPGDLDGDTVPDIFASDWSNDAKGPGTGRIYVYSGKTGKRLYQLTGNGPGENFGTTHSTAGDVDGDGYPDLIVGAWQYGPDIVGGGRAYLFSGRTGKVLRTYTDKVPGDTFGFDAVGMGDIDGDGVADLLVTAAWSPVRGPHSGRVFLISSGIGR